MTDADVQEMRNRRSGAPDDPAARLQRAFAEVRALLFPRWDRAYRWRIVLGDCRDDRRVSGDGEHWCIAVRPEIAARGGEALRFNIARAIAGAIAGGRQGKRFRARLSKAAADARLRGMEALAAMLEREAAGGGPVHRLSDDDVRLMVEELLMEIPASSRTGTERLLTAALGLEPGELEGRYRRLRRMAGGRKAKGTG